MLARDGEIATYAITTKRNTITTTLTILFTDNFIII
jgi:hypothetical protein